MARRNETDRVAAERAARQTQARSNAIQAEAAKKRAEIDDLAAKAEATIPAALASLVRRNYPGLEQLSAYVPRPMATRVLGKDKLTSMGGYKTASFHRNESSMMAEGTYYVYLLSNGRLMVGSGSSSIREFVQRVKNEEGLGDSRYKMNLAAYHVPTLRQLVAWLETEAAR